MARAFLVSLLVVTACGGAPERRSPTRDVPARNLLLITIDTLRADRVGAYGDAAARTPAMDALAARGVRFEHAYSAAPITLTSHATMMTGRYPPGHGARHNGMRVSSTVPTIADILRQQGLAAAAFVSAFPLDHTFGLNRGFATYSDRMPRGANGRLASERPGRVAADEAMAWLDAHRSERFFLWLHLFEPHAPYGDPSDGRPVAARYDDEVAEADRQAGRVIEALGAARASTLVIMTADHGEAFGEHGEVSHSLFVYDTTLRVPLVMAGPGIRPTVVTEPVGLVDLAKTMVTQLGVGSLDADGIDLSPALRGEALPARELYAETFAPLLDFGWSPLRAIRSGAFKFIAAPKPELFNVAVDAGETQNLAAADTARRASLSERVERISSATLPLSTAADPDAAARLQALGYVSSGGAGGGGPRPDPKDRRELARRLAQVTSGELSGAALRTTLEQILNEDPQNPQAHVRLGYVLLERRECARAETHFAAAIAGQLPGADAFLGLASCQAAARQFAAAGATLVKAEQAEPDNPMVVANRGILLSDSGQPREAVPVLQRALTLDPDFNEARFNLALAHLRAGQRPDAAREATELLRRLPAGASQRAEVERLLATAR
ncbi:MAG: sulfatase-like hydrolase/transferase [Vicinamibacterales bacterium]